MTHRRLLTVLTGIVAGAVTLFLTASVSYALLRRLGDETGAAWAAGIALCAAGWTIVSLSVAFLTNAGNKSSIE
ncbi:MAG: hypothetical protein WBC44_04200 [Planctomycetaceae bacterium]